MRLVSKGDERYNSGLFHFHKEKDRTEDPDTLTPTIKIDDARLKPILKCLLVPVLPRQPLCFLACSGRILGQVYEQFLGQVIRITPGRQVKVEPKPEVKKAGGVYYTPTYVVDYIVKNTVGKLVEGKTPKQLARMRVLDPACGSGSFLIGAYQFLLNWYRDEYVKDGSQKHKNELVRDEVGNWRLTLNEKKKVLVRHIYGVDIDMQAVEVTKLSLLLKVLEGESQFKLFHERALPDLGNNIKCGNSLIGPNFYDNRQMFLLDQEDRYRINVFDWDQGFPEVMKEGGFDAVIGNPPYVRAESIKELKPYFERCYVVNDAASDLYTFFMEKALSLIRTGGLFSFIVSSSFLRTSYAAKLRDFLRKNIRIVRVVDFGGLPVFAHAKDTYVCIPLFAKSSPERTVEICKVSSLSNLRLDEFVASHSYPAPLAQFTSDSWSLASEGQRTTFEKILKAGTPLGKVVGGRIYYGIKTGLNEAFEIDKPKRNEIVKSCSAAADIIRPFFGGQNIRRYYAEDAGRFLIAMPSGWTRGRMLSGGARASTSSERAAWNWLNSEFQPVAEHLEQFREAAKARQDSGEFWWELRPCDYYEVFSKTKVIYPDITKGPRFTLDSSGALVANTGYVLGTDDPFLLAILNSRLAWFAVSCISIPFGVRAGEFRYRLIYQYMEKLPIRVLTLSALDLAARNNVVDLVDGMIKLHVQLGGLELARSAPLLSVRSKRRIGRSTNSSMTCTA